MTFEVLKGQKPSSAFQEKIPEKYNGKYKYGRKIHRIRSISDIEYLLNNEYKKKGSSYFGKITGIQVKINFSIISSCSLNTTTEEELEKVYREVLRILP